MSQRFPSLKILQDGYRHVVRSLAPHGPTSSHDRPGPLKQRPPDGTWSCGHKISQGIPRDPTGHANYHPKQSPCSKERKTTTMSAEPSAVRAPVDRRRTCHRRGCEPLHLRQGFGSWFPWPSQVVSRIKSAFSIRSVL